MHNFEIPPGWLSFDVSSPESQAAYLFCSRHRNNCPWRSLTWLLIESIATARNWRVRILWKSYFFQRSWNQMRIQLFVIHWTDRVLRALQLIVFISGQKMALRRFYFIVALTKALIYCYINRSQRHLLPAIENDWLEGPFGNLRSSNLIKINKS